MIYAMNSHDAQLLTILGCWDKWLAQQGMSVPCAMRFGAGFIPAPDFFNNRQIKS